MSLLNASAFAMPSRCIPGVGSSCSWRCIHVHARKFPSIPFLLSGLIQHHLHPPASHDPPISHTHSPLTHLLTSLTSPHHPSRSQPYARQPRLDRCDVESPAGRFKLLRRARPALCLVQRYGMQPRRPSRPSHRATRLSIEAFWNPQIPAAADAGDWEARICACIGNADLV